jgi:hypothetical protein
VPPCGGRERRFESAGLSLCEGFGLGSCLQRPSTAHVARSPLSLVRWRVEVADNGGNRHTSQAVHLHDHRDPGQHKIKKAHRIVHQMSGLFAARPPRKPDNHTLSRISLVLSDLGKYWEFIALSDGAANCSHTDSAGSPRDAVGPPTWQPRGVFSCPRLWFRVRCGCRRSSREGLARNEVQQHYLGDILAIPVARHGFAYLRVLTRFSTGSGSRSALASGAAGVAVGEALGWWAAVCVHRGGKSIRICGVGLGLSIMVCCCGC